MIDIVPTVNKSVIYMLIYCMCKLYSSLRKKINKKQNKTEMYIGNSLNQQVVQTYKIAGLPPVTAV